MKKFGFLGLGKMGSSILNGILSNKLYDIKDLAFYAPSAETKKKYQEKIEIVRGGLSSCIMSFWFVQLLFVASIIFYLVVDYALEKGSRLISIIIGLLFITMIFAHFNIYLPFYLAEAPAIAAIMLVGAFFGQKELLSNKTKLSFVIINSIISYAIFVILALLFQGS